MTFFYKLEFQILLYKKYYILFLNNANVNYLSNINNLNKLFIYKFIFRIFFN